MAHWGRKELEQTTSDDQWLSVLPSLVWLPIEAWSWSSGPPTSAVEVFMPPNKCHVPQGLVRLHCSHRWHLQHTRAEMLKIVGPTASGQASWKCLTSWTDGQEPPAPYWRWLCSWSGDAQGYRSGLGLSPGHWASHSQGHRLSVCP